MARQPTWRRTAFGHSFIPSRWSVRVVTARVDGGPPLYWPYRDTNRFTPTGKHRDSVSFRSLRTAKRFVERMVGK